MKYFSIQELTNSNTAKKKGIDNTPSLKIKNNLLLLIEKILDPLREAYGKPIVVTSGYRCPALNRAVGGAVTSQHQYGYAADIRSVSDSYADNKKLYNLIISLRLPFDLLIDEHHMDWVHVSYSPRNRRQILKV